jgi:Xaa-Pro aminopeptidase
LDAQYAAIDAVKPGNHWNHPHEAAVRVITNGLIHLGLIEAELEEAIEKELYKPFYMHRTGHWLGLDVHDVGEYKIAGEWRLLEPGMVLTVEPGIYVSPSNKDVHKKWRGIGIRIEDDVLVTKSGCRVLTESVPKEIKDIEALMAGDE